MNKNPNLHMTVFQANFSCFIGNHAIVMGEAMEVLEDVEGLYCLFFENDKDPIARLNKNDVNKLAGRELIK
jgi:hypothetical protein